MSASAKNVHAFAAVLTLEEPAVLEIKEIQRPLPRPTFEFHEIPELDGFRGMAILCVIIGHFLEFHGGGHKKQRRAPNVGPTRRLLVFCFERISNHRRAEPRTRHHGPGASQGFLPPASVAAWASVAVVSCSGNCVDEFWADHRRAEERIAGVLVLRAQFLWQKPQSESYLVVITGRAILFDLAASIFATADEALRSDGECKLHSVGLMARRGNIGKTFLVRCRHLLYAAIFSLRFDTHPTARVSVAGEPPPRLAK